MISPNRAGVFSLVNWLAECPASPPFPRISQDDGEREAQSSS
jgi:hypothetical protein